MSLDDVGSAESQSADSSESFSINRRRVLQGFGAVSAGALAGCPSGGDGDGGDGGPGGGGSGQDLGERVPEPLVVVYTGQTPDQRVSEEVAKEIQETLGVETEVELIETVKHLPGMFNDYRAAHFTKIIRGFMPSRLDPWELTRAYAIDWAGANNKANMDNYANCEYSKYALGQQFSPTPEDREAVVERAIQIYSEDIGSITLYPVVNYTLTRDDRWQLNNVGKVGDQWGNVELFLNSTPVDDSDTINLGISPFTLSTANMFTNRNLLAAAMWSTMPFTQLNYYTPDFELENLLAESIEVSDDAKRITVAIRDGTFHNGDPITSEDVKFTFKHLWENQQAYPQSAGEIHESIDIVDDKTVEFNFKEPSLWVRGREFPQWGIVHKQSWIEQGAQDDPGGFHPDPIIGSGPWQVDQFEPQQSLVLSPHDGHPTMQPEHGYNMRAFDNYTTATEALIQGELDGSKVASSGNANRAEESLGDNVTVHVIAQPLPERLSMSFARPPVKFHEFRDAVAKLMNRSLMGQLHHGDYFEEITPSFAMTDFQRKHPWRPDEDTLYKPTTEPTGDPEAAKQTLRDAGWGWDDNGNLRYPADADTSPLWPKDEVPGGEAFPCMEDGEYVGEMVSEM